MKYKNLLLLTLATSISTSKMMNAYEYEYSYLMANTFGMVTLGAMALLTTKPSDSNIILSKERIEKEKNLQNNPNAILLSSKYDPKKDTLYNIECCLECYDEYINYEKNLPQPKDLVAKHKKITKSLVLITAGLAAVTGICYHYKI